MAQIIAVKEKINAISHHNVTLTKLEKKPIQNELLDFLVHSFHSDHKYLSKVVFNETCSSMPEGAEKTDGSVDIAKVLAHIKECKFVKHELMHKYKKGVKQIADLYGSKKQSVDDTEYLEIMIKLNELFI